MTTSALISIRRSPDQVLANAPPSNDKDEEFGVIECTICEQNTYKSQVTCCGKCGIDACINCMVDGVCDDCYDEDGGYGKEFLDGGDECDV